MSNFRNSSLNLKPHKILNRQKLSILSTKIKQQLTKADVMKTFKWEIWSLQKKLTEATKICHKKVLTTNHCEKHYNNFIISCNVIILIAFYHTRMFIQDFFDLINHKQKVSFWNKNSWIFMTVSHFHRCRMMA